MISSDPRSFMLLPPFKQQALLLWIALALKPHRTIYCLPSDILKEFFEKESHPGCSERRFSITDGEFRGGMLVSGYEPLDRNNGCWHFFVRPRFSRWGMCTIPDPEDREWLRTLIEENDHTARRRAA